MLHGGSAGASGVELQRVERKAASGFEIAHAMLVMHGQRFGGLACETRWTTANLEQPSPGGRRLLELATTPREHRAGVQRLGACDRLGRRHIRGVRKCISRVDD